VLSNGQPRADDLQVVDVLEVDPFAELSMCIAVHRDAIVRLRAIAGRTRNDAIAIGAVKACAALSADLFGLLSNAGAIPRSSVDWGNEVQWRSAWEVLTRELQEAGVDADRFIDRVQRRLAQACTTELRVVGLGPALDAALEAAA
jgi:hypothetical protein